MTKRKRHVAIAICTLQRPKMLEKCLISLSKQHQPPDTKITIVVIENDIRGPSRALVENLYVSLFKSQNIDVIFCVEPERGIPYARNKALATCRKLKPDWVAFIDDDETAAPDWLKNHLSAQEEFEADVLYGQVHSIYEVEPPAWFEHPKFKKEHGKILKRAATNNVFMDFWVIDPDGLNLNFDTHFSQGHEDTEFFERARAFGAKIVLNQKALVTEFVPASRLTFKRHVTRMFQNSVTDTYEQIYKRGWWYAFFKQIITINHYSRFIRGILALILAAFIIPFSNTKGQRTFFYGVKRLVKVVGSFYGLTNRQVKYWDTIDGY